MLATTYGALAVHEATAIWDVAYADGRREITPTEQHVHGFLERVAMMGAAFLTVLHWDQARAVFGLGEKPSWRLRPKRRRLSSGYRVAILTAAGGDGRCCLTQRNSFAASARADAASRTMLHEWESEAPAAARQSCCL